MFFLKLFFGEFFNKAWLSWAQVTVRSDLSSSPEVGHSVTVPEVKTPCLRQSPPLSSPFQFFQSLSLFTRTRSLPVPPSQLPGELSTLKKFDPRPRKKGSRPVAPLIPWKNMDIPTKALCPQENYTFEGGSEVFSGPKCTFLSGPFLVVSAPPLLHQESGHSGLPFKGPWRHSSIPREKCTF